MGSAANYGMSSRPRTGLGNLDGAYSGGSDLYNVYGFQQKQVTLQDAFGFRPFTFPQ